MIKASELRIGNWVSYKGDFNFVVANINHEGAGDNEDAIYFDSNLIPIEISPEILEKAGFEKSIYDIWVRGSFSLDYWEDNKMYSFSCGEESVIVDYLHQLQNLYFALSGEELTITL